MTFSRILVPTDFSTHADKAVDLAVKLAGLSGGKITLLHIGVTPEIYATWGLTGPMLNTVMDMSQHLAEEQMTALTAQAEARIPASCRDTVLLRSGYPPEQILAVLAEGGYDVVVMGTHGRTGLDRVFIGSVAERVIRKSEVPVLIAR